MVTCCGFCGADLSNRPPTGVFGRAEDRCPDCGLAAESDVPALVPTEEEMVYDVGQWRTRDRLLLARTLVERDVPFRWEPGPVLAVHENDVALVEEVLDELDEIDPGGEDDDLSLVIEGLGGGDERADEAAHQAMGDLFVAADRLRHGAADPAVAEELSDLLQVVASAGPPFGVERRVWDEIGKLGASLRDALDEQADEDVVGERATALRDLLRPLV